MACSFDLGRVVITANAQQLLHREDILAGLSRHSQGDWGDLSAEDKAENELSLDQGFRIQSAYHDRNGVKYWVITEADRSSTCILLPDDY